MTKQICCNCKKEFEGICLCKVDKWYEEHMEKTEQADPNDPKVQEIYGIDNKEDLTFDLKKCPIHGEVSHIDINEGKFKGKSYCEQCYIENVIVKDCEEVE